MGYSLPSDIAYIYENKHGSDTACDNIAFLPDTDFLSLQTHIINILYTSDPLVIYIKLAESLFCML